MGEESEPPRIDRFLALRFPRFSRTYFQHLIDCEVVSVNGKVVKKRIRPKEGDIIDLLFLPKEEVELTPYPAPLEILFEDDHLLCVNKEAGMVMHPSPGHTGKTFVNALLHHCKERLPGPPDKPGIVHRLDKDTSGVLLVAKSQVAYEKLREQFKERTISKHYVAISYGNPSSCTINAPIGRNPVRKTERTVVTTGGKEAKTIVTPIAHAPPFSLLAIHPVTGRTHQIRVHLQHIGAPVLGDGTYGRPLLNIQHGISRQLLHAESITFNHPTKREAMTLTAPFSEEMSRSIKKWFGHAWRNDAIDSLSIS